MRLVFHGLLRNLYGESVVMHAETPADAIEGFSRQQKNWPTDLLISVPGFETDLMLRKGFAKEIHLLPALAGGGGKFTNIIIGAALIVVGVILLPSPMGWSLIVSGGLMVLQGVISLFMKAPKNTNSNDPDASKYLAVNKNTTAVGTPITMAWGRIDLAGHWLSLQSDSSNLAFGTFPTTPT